MNADIPKFPRFQTTFHAHDWCDVKTQILLDQGLTLAKRIQKLEELLTAMHRDRCDYEDCRVVEWIITQERMYQRYLARPWWQRAWIRTKTAIGDAIRRWRR